MGVRIELKIRHINGTIYTIETSRDADIIGVKIALFEKHKIAIESQRLVFNGKELIDSAQISSLGIKDGSILFLVESKQPENVPVEVSAPVQPVQAVPVQAPQSFAPPVNEPVNPPPVNPVNVVVVNNNRNYEPLGGEVYSQERIQRVIDLAFWTRMYCLFSILVSVLSLAWSGIFGLIFIVFYLLGYFGTRYLNRCLLVFPIILTLITGILSIGGFIGMCVYDFNGWAFVWLIIGILKLIIFASICKLVCLIGKLSVNEKAQAVRKIRARCCC